MIAAIINNTTVAPMNISAPSWEIVTLATTGDVATLEPSLTYAAGRNQ